MEYIKWIYICLPLAFYNSREGIPIDKEEFYRKHIIDIHVSLLFTF